MLQQATGGGAAASGGAAAAGSTEMRGKDITWHSDMQDTRIPTKLSDTIPKMYRSVTVVA